MEDIKLSEHKFGNHIFSLKRNIVSNKAYLEHVKDYGVSKTTVKQDIGLIDLFVKRDGKSPNKCRIFLFGDRRYTNPPIIVKDVDYLTLKNMISKLNKDIKKLKGRK